MATKTPGKKFQAGKRMAHLFPNHHETLKRSEREDGSGKALYRLVAASSENSRTNCCINVMALFFRNLFLTIRTYVQNECMFLQFSSFNFVKIEQYFHPCLLE